MKDKLEKIQGAVVSVFATVSLICTGIQPAIKLVKEGVHAGYKETGIHEKIFTKPAPKQPAKNK
jgi:tRNA(Phe) wybutosine-synthesizing methylase Tyw3